jgi:hypothetical protein
LVLFWFLVFLAPPAVLAAAIAAWEFARALRAVSALGDLDGNLEFIKYSTEIVKLKEGKKTNV